jgi:CRISPR/Cas system CSM-associated protein Csm3 (group 7 of RAMP superfamily)
MNNLNFRIRLCADAELGTGLGGELVNNFLPRDALNMPHIPASHIKGLMRAALREIATPLRDLWEPCFKKDSRPSEEWPSPLLRRVFDPNGDDVSAVPLPSLSVSDASLQGPKFLRNGSVDRVAVSELISTVTRTQLSAHGIAEAMSLRTTEALATGSEFFGRLEIPFSSGTVEHLAAQLALLSISAVGGSRNRGGQCVVDLVNGATAQRLSALLQQLNQALQSNRFHEPAPDFQRRHSTASSKPSINCELVELLFVADSPICIPEHPCKSNAIVSGFSIPASAVQGMLLTHINTYDPELASQLFEHPGFRCWPLQPCGDPADSEVSRVATVLSQTQARQGGDRAAKLSDLTDVFNTLPHAVRVSLSHRAAKLSTGRLDDFFEQAFGPRERAYDWMTKAPGAPLKAVDGVLLATENKVRLWSARAMRRHLTSHGVIEGSQRGDSPTRRNLFSVEAMAPLIWRGMVSLPENVTQRLLKSIDAQLHFHIGKAKSVRGRGRLYGRKLPSESLLFEGASSQPTVLILQSPTAIPEDVHRAMQKDCLSAEDVLEQVATQWLRTHNLPPLAPQPCSWASVGLQFGWNRHRRGLQSALPVLQPGSILVLESRSNPEALQKAIMAGFRLEASKDDAMYRQRGLGAIAVHPGMTEAFYEPGGADIPALPKSEMQLAMQSVLAWKKAPYLPSASQIRAIEQRLPNVAAALHHLEKQIKQRAVTRHTWEPIHKSVRELITESPNQAKWALDALADIATGFEAGDN